MLLGALLNISHAQITLDGSLGPAGALTGPNYVIPAEVGQTRGGNLFHSFGLFNVPTNQRATFTGPSSISNILSRVTGGQRSTIDGLLRSEIPGANLFLFNPAGVFFGPNATLDVKGSFHVSTADYLKFADGAQFHADLARQSVLTSAPVSAFGFLSQNPASISLHFKPGPGPGPGPGGPRPPNLQVPAGQTLSFVGGDVSIEGNSNPIIPTVFAPDGKVQLASVASPGEVPLDVQDLNLSAFERLGQLSLSNGVIDVVGGQFSLGGTADVQGGGSVVIRGGRFVLDQSTVGGRFEFRDFRGFTGSGPRIDIAVTGDAVLSNRSSIQTDTLGFQHGGGEVKITADSLQLSESSIISNAVGENSGNAPNITLNVRNLILQSGRIGSETLGPGNAGSITVKAEKATMTGSRIFTDAFATGNGGDILLDVGELRLEGGSMTFAGEVLEIPASITASTFNQGRGGNLTINARDSIVISNASEVLTRTAPGTFDWSQGGPAGRILIQSPSLLIANGSMVGSPPESLSPNAASGDVVLNIGALTIIDAQVNSSAQFGAAGIVGFGSFPPPGNITIAATDVTLDKGSITTSVFGGNHRGGDITVSARQIRLSNGSFISSDSSGSGGNAGNITIWAPTLAMADGGKISVETLGAGSAGSILLNANNFSLTGGAQVVSSTSGSGQGGSVTATATESASFTGSGSGLFSTASSTGNAGEVTVSTPNLAMSEGGTISVATSGAGNAGNVLLNASNFSLTGGAQVVSSTISEGQGGTVTLSAVDSISISGQGTGLFSTASSTGNAGRVTVTAPALAPVPTLTMADGGTISVATSGAGSAGSILLNANNFSLTGGAQVVSSTSGSGQGGSVTATAGELISISGNGNLPSGLFSTASSTGNAGQITVFTPTLTMGERGTISVATEGSGNAGNIMLNVTNLTQTGGAQVVSSTTGAGAGGNLTVTAANSIAVSGSGSEPSGLFSTASSTGNAGEVTVSTPSLTMGDGGTISVATSGAGNAGNVLLNVNNFSLTGGAQIVSSTSGAGQGGTVSAKATDSASISGQGTGMFSNASGGGAGGTINLQAGQLQITDLGVVSANSTGTATATAGNVNIVAGELVQMQNGSVTTESTLADGGNISITTTGSMVRLNDSQITTSVGSGAGSGGNITIGSDFVLLNNSQIRADAFGGPGGNITIVAETFLPSNSLVSASSALSTPGTIAIEATFTDVTGSVAQLPETPLQATELLRASCAARFAGGKASSLVLGGRDGLPLQPGGLLPSPLYVAGPSSGDNRLTAEEVPLRFTLLESKDRLLNQYSFLPNARCSL